MHNRKEQEIMKNWKGDKDKPIVSVCCATYNHEKFISETIDGFLMQETDFPFEIIIRDDASIDNTAKIIEKYEKKFPKLIKPIYEKENTFSKGIKPTAEIYKVAKGRYFALCEGDDYWIDTKKLQVQKDFLDNNQEYVICYNGVSYNSADLNPSETAMVTLKSFARDGGFRLDGFKEYTGKYKETHIVKQGDLAVAHTDITQDAAVVGNPILIIGKEEYKTLVISMDLVKVETTKNWISKEFLYFLMKTRLFKQHCLGYANGSTVLHLSKKAIPSFEFFLPPKDIIEKFTEQASNLLNKKNTNISQIRTLEKMRDTLLPKLMSGEIQIKS